MLSAKFLCAVVREILNPRRIRFLLENLPNAAMVARHGQSHSRTFGHGGGGVRGTA